MRRACDGMLVAGNRLSITAAMVIAQSALRKCLRFSAWGDLCKEMSTKSNDNARGTGNAACCDGAWGAGQPTICQPPEAGVRLAEWLREAEHVAERRRRRHSAL